MNKIAVLAELRAVAANAPDFRDYSPSSRPHLEWIGKACAVLSRWNKLESIQFMSAAGFLAIELTRDTNVAQMLALLHRAIADLELEVGALPPQAFGPGAVYDFHKALRETLSTAQKSLFIVDPYLDDQIFDAYLTSVDPRVQVRLLAREYVASLKTAVSKFNAQNKMAVEIRSAKAIHDRVVFIDDVSCWVLGQSIKDAAKNKPTYLAPLSLDAVQLKKGFYEQIWEGASPV